MILTDDRYDGKAKECLLGPVGGYGQSTIVAFAGYDDETYIASVCRYVAFLTEVLYHKSDRAVEGIKFGPVRSQRVLRQIAIYVCHTLLGVSFGKLAKIFGLDRSTIYHACGIVEDKREQVQFDEFVGVVETLVAGLEPIIRPKVPVQARA